MPSACGYGIGGDPRSRAPPACLGRLRASSSRCACSRRGFASTQAKPGPAMRALGFCLRSAPSALLTTAQQQPSLQPQPLLLPPQQPQPQPQLLLLPPQQQQQQPLLLPPQLLPPPQQQHSRRIRMMIHQQPPPKPPLLPQHMICHLTFDVPVTETGPDAAPGGARGGPRSPWLSRSRRPARTPSPGGAGAEPRGLPAPRPAFLPVSASYYVGAGKLVPTLFGPPETHKE